MADGEVCEVTAALADFEEKLLVRPEFFKTHRSYLVNLNYVQAIGANCVVTKNGHDIPVSRHRRNEVQDAYMRFLNKAESVILREEKQTKDDSERSEGEWRILLVDDDTAERAYWAEILQAHGCIVQMAENGGEALKLAEEESCNCVLLDVMIPGEDGFAICERLIDYITKDTPPELFWAKVKTRIRLSAAGGIRTKIHYGPLLLDLEERRTKMDGKELFLTPDEFDILWRLSEHAGCVLTPEEIAALVYGSRPGAGGEKVQVHMSRLRRKLDKAGEGHRYIETVWGQGYRFVP